MSFNRREARYAAPLQRRYRIPSKVGLGRGLPAADPARPTILSTFVLFIIKQFYLFIFLDGSIGILDPSKYFSVLLSIKHNYLLAEMPSTLWDATSSPPRSARSSTWLWCAPTSSIYIVSRLYTITTLVLVGQVIYYQHILKWWKARLVTPAPPITSQQDEAKSIEAKPALPQASSQPIAYAPSPPSSVPVYYMSARSLASSRTPTRGSFLVSGSRGSGGRESSNFLLQHNSLEHFHESQPMPISINTSRSAPAPINVGASPSILRAVVSIAICVGGLNIGRGLTLKRNTEIPLHASNVPRVFTGRKLFQSKLHTRIFSGALVHQTTEMEGSIGVVFGWMMAAIYMGGRLPQIWLNIKRGSVEGLNPLMFTFALLGNVTYMGSILIRSTDWKNIQSNMPWLVDAGVCVLLDCLILCQFIYYLTWKQRDAKNEAGGDYKSLDQ